MELAGGAYGEVLVRHYFPYVDFDSLKYEEQTRMIVDAMWIEKREIDKLAAGVAKALGG